MAHETIDSWNFESPQEAYDAIVAGQVPDGTIVYVGYSSRKREADHTQSAKCKTIIRIAAGTYAKS